jgi:hypothetical protein
METEAFPNEVLSQFQIVVNLTIINESDAPIFSLNGLMTPFQIDDGQPAMTENEMRTLNESLAVRPPMGQPGFHLLDELYVFRPKYSGGPYDAANAAHEDLGMPLSCFTIPRTPDWFMGRVV